MHIDVGGGRPGALGYVVPASRRAAMCGVCLPTHTPCVFGVLRSMMSPSDQIMSPVSHALLSRRG